MNKIHWLPFYVLILLGSCQATNDNTPINPAPASGAAKPIPCVAQPASRPGAKKILFVGNSLTYTNELPALVAAIGAQNNLLVEQQMLAFPNYALEDHWNEGCLQALIKSGYYDFVVVQQGPSSQADGRRILLEYGELIQQLCLSNDTKLAFFMVWPARINYQTFDGVIKNYTDAANATGALLCPVGLIWKNHFDLTGDFSYYSPDGFHPSQKGSELAAEVIYKVLFP